MTATPNMSVHFFLPYILFCSKQIEEDTTDHGLVSNEWSLVNAKGVRQQKRDHRK